MSGWEKCAHRIVATMDALDARSKKDIFRASGKYENLIRAKKLYAAEPESMFESPEWAHIMEDDDAVYTLASLLKSIMMAEKIFTSDVTPDGIDAAVRRSPLLLALFQLLGKVSANCKVTQMILYWGIHKSCVLGVLGAGFTRGSVFVIRTIRNPILNRSAFLRCLEPCVVAFLFATVTFFLPQAFACQELPTEIAKSFTWVKNGTYELSAAMCPGANNATNRYNPMATIGFARWLESLQLGMRSSDSGKYTPALHSRRFDSISTKNQFHSHKKPIPFPQQPISFPQQTTYIPEQPSAMQTTL